MPADGCGSVWRWRRAEGEGGASEAKEEVRVGSFSNALRRHWRGAVACTERLHAPFPLAAAAAAAFTPP